MGHGSASSGDLWSSPDLGQAPGCHLADPIFQGHVSRAQGDLAVPAHGGRENRAHAAPGLALVSSGGLHLELDGGLLQAVLGACAGDEVAVSLCGDETQAVDLFVDCD
ncbi:MAG: hypothetical protein QGG40_06670 [Myxococcota bacterium]|nr:hypothetical protein [Myxococcota bacterium]